MFGMFQKARISTKLTGTISAALIGLCIMGAIAVFAARSIHTLGMELFTESDRVSNVQIDLAVGIERGIADVHAAPSELDLNQLKVRRAHFDSVLANVRQLLAGEVGRGADPGMRTAEEAIQQELSLFETGAKKVFDQSAAFAQPDAIATLSGTVIPAEATLQAALERLNRAADQYDALKVANMDDVTANVTWLVIGLAGLIVVIVSALAYVVVSRGVAQPLTAFNRSMLRLAGGDTSVEIPFTVRPDEIGDIARAVEVFKTNMIETERLTSERETARLARMQRQDAMERHTAEFGTSVTAVLDALTESSARMRKAADTMANASEAVHREAAATSDGAAKSSRDLTAVAAAVEELTASFLEISRQVTAAAAVSRTAVQRADASQASISSLADSTARIGNVVRLISDIAGQTNLLALNATIEAARAGEAGRGFAVVAGEVKTLAAQTANATAEIGGQIDTVRAATEATIAAMAEISTMIGQMDQVSAAIAAAVEQQSATTRDIAASVQSVTGATVQSAEAMNHVVTVADQSGAASRDVIASASDIGQEAVTLRGEVDRFLHAVNSDTSDRRLYERLLADHVTALLRLSPGQAAVKVTVKDLSRGGVALTYNKPIATGTQVWVDLPASGGEVAGKVTRVADNVLAIEFQDDRQSRDRVEAALLSLSAYRPAA